MRAATLNSGEGASALSLRQRIEDEIERLIAMLDAFDGDENLEPSLGRQGDGSADDREGDPCDQGEPDVDDEHSLGWSIPDGPTLTNPPPGWSYTRLGAVAGDYED